MHRNRPPAPRRRPGPLSVSFRSDRSGAAAIELGILLPFITAALISMVDVGNAVYMKYDVERKMRLAIEGIERHGIDSDSVVAFANADGNAAFNGQNDVATNPATLSLSMSYLCRADDLTATSYDAIDDVQCLDYETWYTITVTRSYTGMFGKSFDLSTTADVMVD